MAADEIVVDGVTYVRKKPVWITNSTMSWEDAGKLIQKLGEVSGHEGNFHIDPDTRNVVFDLCWEYDWDVDGKEIMRNQ
jgi:hypothetical protein